MLQQSAGSPIGSYAIISGAEIKENDVTQEKLERKQYSNVGECCLSEFQMWYAHTRLAAWLVK